MTKIFATGKSGTIGRFLPEEFIRIDFRTESFESEFQEYLGNEQFSVIHLAGIVGETRVTQNLVESQNVNVRKTAQMAEFCAKKKLKKFFYISTSHVYSKSEQPISELAPLDPRSEYSKQKLEAEIELAKIFNETPEKLCILRIFSVLSLESPDFTLGAAIRRAASNPEFKIINVDDQRDFLHPRQIIEILTKLVLLDDLPRVINICSGNAISVRDGIQQIVNQKNLRINDKQLIAGTSENPIIAGDATLLNSILLQDSTGYVCFD